MSDKSLSGLRL